VADDSCDARCSVAAFVACKFLEYGDVSAFTGTRIGGAAAAAAAAGGARENDCGVMRRVGWPLRWPRIKVDASSDGSCTFVARVFIAHGNAVGSVMTPSSRTGGRLTGFSGS